MSSSLPDISVHFMEFPPDMDDLLQGCVPLAAEKETSQRCWLVCSCLRGSSV